MAVSCSFSLTCFHPECFLSDQGQPAWFRCIHEHDNILQVMGVSDPMLPAPRKEGRLMIPVSFFQIWYCLR